MILCARCMSRSREQRSRSENMWKVCLFYRQNNKIVWLSNMSEMLLRNSRGAQRFVGFDCAFRVLIGWAGKLWSREHKVQRPERVTLYHELYNKTLYDKVRFTALSLTFFLIIPVSPFSLRLASFSSLNRRSYLFLMSKISRSASSSICFFVSSYSLNCWRDSSWD